MLGEVRSLDIGVIVNGLYRACSDARTKLSPPVDAHLLMCFTADGATSEQSLTAKRSSEVAMDIFGQLVKGGHVDKIIGVGFDTSALDRPANAFEEVENCSFARSTFMS